MSIIYKRVLLKLSGEALMGSQKFGQDPEIIRTFCIDIVNAHKLGHQICIVVGGGNICRGKSVAQMGIDRATADHMGMLATVINALAIQSTLEAMGVQTRVQSAVAMMEVCEPYIRRRAIRHMENGIIVIFASGTGNPFFTTDTAAALRAAETNCDAILKGTQVDGLFSADPKLDANATMYNNITYSEVIKRDLNAMDTAAITLARDNDIPIIIFNIHKKDAFTNVLNLQGTFTKITS